MLENDTITQIVTAPGRGAVGIVRLSGDDALTIAQKIYDGQSRLTEAASHTIHYGWVCRPDGTRVDEALFMVMRAPRSYTGDDVVEIQCHGGSVATGEVLRLTMLAGARAAESGEFTRRAFLAGKLDFTQAEAIMDLVDARTSERLALAANQKGGALQEKIESARADVLALIAYIQADIDYPEDDIERLTENEYVVRAQKIEEKLRALIASSARGRLYHEGLVVAILGRPNVGKSSLFNALAGRESAIVTNIAGTTRDVVREDIQLNGFPIRMWDTAGIRETDDVVEAIGVDRARAAAQEADVVIYVMDDACDKASFKQDHDMIKELKASSLIVVRNKMDLVDDAEAAKNKFIEGFTSPPLPISAKTGQGIDVLKDQMLAIVQDQAPMSADGFYVTNLRHLTHLESAADDLAQFQRDVMAQIPPDLTVIALQHAWDGLGLITGATAADNLLDEIFSKFCLGK